MSRQKPIEEKRLIGTENTTRSRRHSEIEYTGEENSMITLPPEDLSIQAQNLWISIVAQHASINLNFPTHYEYLQAYCRLYEIREAAYLDYLKEGRYVMEGEKVLTDLDGNEIRTGGVRRISQSYRLFTDTVKNMIEIGGRLGLTMYDKTKVSSLIVDDKSNRRDKNSQKRITVSG